MSAKKDVYHIATLQEHMTTKGMWAGSLKFDKIKDFTGVLNNNIVELKTNQVGALLKAIDEIIVNATDHYAGCKKNLMKSRRVTKINVSFINGIVTVYNNGPGLPLGINSAATKKNGYTVYEPEVAFSEGMAGSNIVKSADNIKGGTNGLGAKIANVHSKWFQINTISRNPEGVKTSYTQIWENRMTERNAPIIAPCEETSEEFTEVTFLPAYADLGYPCEANGLPDDQTLKDIECWVNLRAHQSATYVGHTVKFMFNDELVTSNSLNNFADLIIRRHCENAHKVIITATSCEMPEYPWNIAVIIYPIDTSIKTTAIRDVSILNGVISNKGSHLTYINSMLKSLLECAFNKADDPDAKTGTELLKGINTQIIFCGTIPGVDWDSQNKQETTIPKRILDKWTITEKSLAPIVEYIKVKILQLKSSVTSVKYIGEPKKYTPARPPRGKKHLTGLMLAEGDSALGMLLRGLSTIKKGSEPGAPSFEWYGMISLQGVILNAARAVSEYKSEYGTVTTMSDSLKNNERLNAIASVVGLQFGQQTAESIAALNYGKLIICVDQDTDGTGKIAGLVLVWLYTCYPGLIESGAVYKFITPLIRAYPKTPAKAPPIEFYALAEYTAWQKTVDTNRYNIKYYKGLATHTAEETKRMFTPTNFAKCIYKYTIDDAAAAHETFNIYFGKEPALRKIALANPPAELPLERITYLAAHQIIPIVDIQLNRDVCEFKRDAISRQIPNCIDGLNPTRRKILFAASMKLNMSTETKVYQFGGFCAENMSYHHGNMSLDSTITYLAQNFIGARMYPLIMPSGDFGNRHGSPAGASRYISVKQSPFYNIVYPKEDVHFLDFEYEDGQKAEPTVMIPVVPMNILESNNNVSEGWRHISYGRDFTQTMCAVRAYIAGDKLLVDAADALRRDICANGAVYNSAPLIRAALSKYPLDVNMYRNKGTIVTVGNKTYSVGKHEIMADGRIHVTELPIGVKTMSYKESICPIDTAPKTTKAKTAENTRAILKIEDYSTDSDVDLILIPNKLNEICAKLPKDDNFTATEIALQLRENITPNLNYIIDRKIVEFSPDLGYMAAFLCWAPRRHELYIKRIEREHAVCTLKAKEIGEIIRFIESGIKINEIEDDDAVDSILQQHDYIRFDTGLLYSPGECKDIEHAVLSGEKISYNYLKNIPVGKFTKKAVIAYGQERAKYLDAAAVALALLNETPMKCGSLWNTEITNFITAYEKYKGEHEAAQPVDTQTKKTTTKRKVSKIAI